MVRIGSPISSRKLGAERFRRWMRSMDFVLGRCWPSLASEEWVFSRVLEEWGEVRASVPYLVGWYRDGGHSELSVRRGDPVWSFFARLLGHRLGRRAVLGCPRVAVLCAATFFDGRWRECEGVLGDDRLACYLYAGVLGGQLPEAIHSRLVMEGMVGKDFVLCRYLRDFCGAGMIS